MALSEGVTAAAPSLYRSSEMFSRTSEAAGAQSEHLTVAGRDHMTVLANIARAGDPARVAMLKFMRDT